MGTNSITYQVYDNLGEVVMRRLDWSEARDMCATSDHLHFCRDDEPTPQPPK